LFRSRNGIRRPPKRATKKPSTTFKSRTTIRKKVDKKKTEVTLVIFKLKTESLDPKLLVK
jgi:hypothetical protein